MAPLIKYKHVIAAAVLLVFCIALYTGAQSIRVLQPNSASYINSRFFPVCISVIMGFVSLLELAASIRSLSGKSSVGSGGQTLSPAGILRIVATLALLAGYVALLNTVGFWIMTTLYLFAQMLLLTPADRRNVRFAAALAFAASTAIYIFFSHILTLVLPRGPLPF
jgi:putative tricarboxylic transport membrane protein